MDDFILTYARNLNPRDFIVKDETFSPSRKAKRQYLNDRLQREFLRKLDDYFRTEVSVPRIMRGQRQELETLITEEALQFARYLRNEIPSWNPRVVSLGD